MVQSRSQVKVINIYQWLPEGSFYSLFPTAEDVVLLGAEVLHAAPEVGL